MKAQLYPSHINVRPAVLRCAAALLLLSAATVARADSTFSPGGPGVIGTQDLSGYAFGVGPNEGTLTWNMDVDAESDNCDTITGSGMYIAADANWVVNINVINTPPTIATTNTYVLFAADPSVAWGLVPTVNLVNGPVGASISSFSVAPISGLFTPPLMVSVSYSGTVVTGTCSQTNNILSLVNNLNGTFTLTAVGTPQAQYYVVTSTSLAVPISQWQVLTDSTNTVSNANGTWTYTTSGPSQQQQFFCTVATSVCP